jgi:hypothetical protein
MALRFELKIQNIGCYANKFKSWRKSAEQTHQVFAPEDIPLVFIPKDLMQAN